MDALRPYLVAGVVVVVVSAWSWRFHVWSNSRTARRWRSPLALGFSATAVSALFLVAGVIGFNLSIRGRFLNGSVWTDGVIWWEVAVGLLLVPVALHLLRRGVRDIGRRLGRT